MAYYKQIGKKHQFQINVNGVREARSFLSKKDGQTWAARREAELLAHDASGKVCEFTLSDAIDKYIDEIAPKHCGERWETVRLRAMQAAKILPMSVPLNDVTRSDIKAWRNVRVLAVSEASAQREMSLLSSVLEAAKTEWEWIEENPSRGIKKLPTAPHRTSVWRYPELKRVLRALNYSPLAGDIQSATQATALVFLLALRTGMRAGEICSLTWKRTEPYYVTLETTKNGSSRNVPLDVRARRVIERARGFDKTLVFGITTKTLDALFRRAKAKAGLKDANLTFHDSRHTAATRLAKDLTMVDLCKMFGWRDPKFALVYYNPDAQGMAQHLDARRTPGAARTNLDQRFNNLSSGFPNQ